jgi:mediator of RNA polymerase II transcription subunit 12
MIENIFSTNHVVDAHAADTLSVTLLNAVKAAVEEDQSQGLELLSSLEPTLTNKVGLT